MSIINEALKKAGQDKPYGEPAATGPSAIKNPSHSSAEQAIKKKQKVNWGPVFVLLVLTLITGPLIAPIFSSPYRSSNAAFLVPSYQQALSEAPQAVSENRRAQFAIEETSAGSMAGRLAAAKPATLPPATIMGQPNFMMNGLVYSSPESYCLINGKIVKVGEKIDGATLLSVTPEKATLSYQGAKIELWVNH